MPLPFTCLFHIHICSSTFDLRLSCRCSGKLRAWEPICNVPGFCEVSRNVERIAVQPVHSIKERMAKHLWGVGGGGGGGGGGWKVSFSPPLFFLEDQIKREQKCITTPRVFWEFMLLVLDSDAKKTWEVSSPRQFPEPTPNFLLQVHFEVSPY